VLRAAGDALAERGPDGLDLADVARRAEVGKTTVYRRWSTPAGLIADLLADRAERPVRPADTGSLEGDLLAHARLVARTLTDRRQGALVRAAVAAASADARAADALRRLRAAGADAWAGCVAAAAERGEVPAGTDAHEVVGAVAAPLYYRFLMGGPQDPDAPRHAAHAAAVAARAGAYVPTGTPQAYRPL
jgi:AcrR family transcriptional regulator